jgi:hypothetical protein
MSEDPSSCLKRQKASRKGIAVKSVHHVLRSVHSEVSQVYFRIFPCRTTLGIPLCLTGCCCYLYLGARSPVQRAVRKV